jgi:outer membrane protein OmpA-like peptidoglycan-associated protein
MLPTTTTRLAAAASTALLLLGGSAFAQPHVQVFDDAPTLEQLRQIMIPESQPGMSRSIVLQRPAVQTSRPEIARASATAPEPSPMPQPMSRPMAEAPELAAAAPVPTVAARPQVQAAAAPRAQPDADTETGVVGFHINFAFDSAELPSSAFRMIDQVAELMKEVPSLRLRVEGHTDAVGSPQYNQTLSERRAAAVAQYLASHGVDPSHFEMVGKGMTEPLTANPYDPSNRRVQFVRIG